MKTIEERLEQLVNAGFRIAEALEKNNEIQQTHLELFKATLGDRVATAALAQSMGPAVTAAKKAKEKAPAPVAEPEPSIGDLSGGEAGPQYTSQDVATALRNLIATDGNKHDRAVKAMIKYGANPVKPLVADVKPEHFASIIDEVNVLIKNKKV